MIEASFITLQIPDVLPLVRKIEAAEKQAMTETISQLERRLEHTSISAADEADAKDVYSSQPVKSDVLFQFLDWDDFDKVENKTRYVCRPQFSRCC